VYLFQGRKSKEIEDRLAFAIEPWSTIQNICKKGHFCEETQRHVLGDSKFGLHLNRNYDVLLRYMTFKKYTGVQFIIIFKVKSPLVNFTYLLIFRLFEVRIS